MITHKPYEPRLLSDATPSIPIQELVHRFTSFWWECSLELPDLGPTYPAHEQKLREASFDRFLKTLNAEFEGMPPAGERRWEAQARIRDATLAFAKAALDFTETDIRVLRSYGFAEIAAQFAHQARQFDPQIGDPDIFQASRNVWSMNFMQLLLGLPIELTPAVFAYSMLYPYTDNYLDDPGISSEAKRAFNQRFALRIAGDGIKPANRQEEVIGDLIGMIEGQFDRSLFPHVYESLLTIHRAQTRSVTLLQKRFSPFEVDVLGICFEKGGTSVLADGYLVNGTLTETQQEIMFYYGTLTQLVDDLEDVAQDLNSGLMTVFSYTAQHWPLDAVTNRTFHFSEKVLEAMDRFDAPAAEPLKQIIRRSICPLLIGEVGSVGRYFSRPYLQKLEAHCPFRFAFIRMQRAKLTKRGLSLIGLIEALAVP